MSPIAAIILISVVTVTVSGDPSLLALNPTLLPDKSLLAARNLLVAEDLLPKPYQFGYKIADGLGMSQHRQEVVDSSGAVKGSYGYIDPLGVQRLVEYKADKDGYRAVVKSNEPGTSEQSSANALFIVETPPQAVLAQGLRPIVVNSL